MSGPQLDIDKAAAARKALDRLLDATIRPGSTVTEVKIWDIQKVVWLVAQLDAALGAAVTPTPQEDRDPADYGSPSGDNHGDETETRCRTCGSLAIDHTSGKFSVYGVCPVTSTPEAATETVMQPVVCGCGHTMACHNIAVPEDQTGCLADDYPCRIWKSPATPEAATEATAMKWKWRIEGREATSGTIERSCADGGVIEAELAGDALHALLDAGEFWDNLDTDEPFTMTITPLPGSDE